MLYYIKLHNIDCVLSFSAIDCVQFLLSCVKKIGASHFGNTHNTHTHSHGENDREIYKDRSIDR